MLVVDLLTFGTMLMAGSISQVIGTAGASIVGRVMGMILASVAAANVLEGIKDQFE